MTYATECKKALLIKKIMLDFKEINVSKDMEVLKMKMTVIECKKEIEKRKKKLLNEKITAQEKAQLKQEIAYFYKRLWVN